MNGRNELRNHPRLASVLAVLLVGASGTGAPFGHEVEVPDSEVSSAAPSVRPPSVVEPRANSTTSSGMLEAEVGRLGRLAASRPHLLQGELSDVVVRLEGGLCTGTPITGTAFVVTAAHCVLTHTGEVRRRAVVRGEHSYPAASVLVNTDYHERPGPMLDAAVLVMEQPIPGPSARVGSVLPDRGRVTLVGFQPVDDEGNLSRNLRPNAVTASTSPTSNPVNRAVRPAGCIQSVQALVVTDARVTVPCGLVPGASGGGLLTVENGEIVLVGIVSTVSADLSANGVVPLDSLHELLLEPERYAHDFPAGDTRRGDSRSPDVSGRTLRS